MPAQEVLSIRDFILRDISFSYFRAFICAYLNFLGNSKFMLFHKLKGKDVICRNFSINFLHTVAFSFSRMVFYAIEDL